MVRLVLFDIDGTLVHTGGAGVKAFGRTFETEFNAKHGLDKLKFAGRTDVSLVREFFNLHNIPATEANFRRFFDHYVFWLDHILKQSETEACPGIERFIRNLKGLPQPPVLGLLTGNVQLGAEIKLRHFNLWDHFVIGGFADDHEDRDKIAAAAHRRGNRLLKEDVHGSEVLVIGDTPLDIKCARAIGARVLAVATGGATLEELQKHKPDWLVPDLTRIRADEVCAG